MDIKKLAPWNWFRKEEEEGTVVPVLREDSRSGLRQVNPAYPGSHFQRDVERMFDDAFRSFLAPYRAIGKYDSLTDSSLLKPRVDIAANDGAYTITVEIPGVNEKDVKLELVEDSLIIRGEKKQEREEKKENYYCVERSYGSFQRTLNLPKDADQDDIKASFKRGVLTISIARWKTAETAKKQIKIHSEQ